MGKKPDITEEEIELFRQAVAGTEPLNNNKRTFTRKKTTTKQPPYPSKKQLHRETLTDVDLVPNVSADEKLSYSRPGLQYKILRRLQQRKFSLDGKLDLHGMNIAEAGEALVDFLHTCKQQEARYVLIVHGKGHRSYDNKPTLKNRVNNWLRQHSQVLAFYSAKPRDGGTGAVYVLLSA